MKRETRKPRDASEAAVLGANCPCGHCGHRPSEPFTPNDLPNFPGGWQGVHLEGRIAATAVRLLATDAENRALRAEVRRLKEALRGLFGMELLERADHHDQIAAVAKARAALAPRPKRGGR